MWNLVHCGGRNTGQVTSLAMNLSIIDDNKLETQPSVGDNIDDDVDGNRNDVIDDYSEMALTTIVMMLLMTILMIMLITMTRVMMTPPVFPKDEIQAQPVEPHFLWMFVGVRSFCCGILMTQRLSSRM